MQARLFKSPFKDATHVATVLNDFNSKKNTQYFITRLKGAIIKQCNAYDNKCSYKDFKQALKSVKAVFIDDQNSKETKNLFMKNNDQLRINDIILCTTYEGINISTQVTEGDEQSINEYIKKQKSPQALQQSILMNRSFINQTNGFRSSSKSPSHIPFKQNFTDMSQQTVFPSDQENIEQFKKIRLPRPKNVRNEINLRHFTQKDILQNTGSQSRNDFTMYEYNFTFCFLLNKFVLKNRLDRIKLHHVGYHHMLVLEKILGEMDPENQGIAEKEKYLQIANKHMAQILTEDLINEIVDYISEGNYISCSKLSGLLDAYKFVPRFPISIGKNDSENYKKKMMEFDITVPKQSNVHELYVLLIEKLEEKFDKFLKAFKFFDVEYDGQIQYTEFKQTLDKLCLRFRDEEVKELFNLLDKKQDGYIDYEEFCQLVPNKLELEMLDRNGENLSLKKRQIQEKFGDLQSFCPDPYRVFERSKYKNPKFLDETTEKIGKEIFYSDQLKKIIENNIVMRKGRCDPGNVFRHGYNIPSDTNQSFTYGIKTKQGENMFDVMNNNFAKEWTIDLEEKQLQKERKLNQLKQKKQTKNTYTNLLRQLHNTQVFNEESRSLPKVKRIGEQNQLKPMFEKTLSDLRKRNHSALFQNNIDTQSDVSSNIGQFMREIRTPNSCISKIDAQNISKTEIYHPRPKSQMKTTQNIQTIPRNLTPHLAALNRTFTCS